MKKQKALYVLMALLVMASMGILYGYAYDVRVFYMSLVLGGIVLMLPTVATIISCVISRIKRAVTPDDGFVKLKLGQKPRKIERLALEQFDGDMGKALQYVGQKMAIDPTFRRISGRYERKRMYLS